MPSRIYYHEGEDGKESFLESSTATRKPPQRSLSWRVTLHLLQWTLICALGLVALAPYTQLRAMNAEASRYVYCKIFLEHGWLIIMWLRAFLSTAPAQHVVRSKNVVFLNGFGRGRTEYMESLRQRTKPRGLISTTVSLAPRCHLSEPAKINDAERCQLVSAASLNPRPRSSSTRRSQSRMIPVTTPSPLTSFTSFTAW